jgi:hypothetical protein
VIPPARTRHRLALPVAAVAVVILSTALALALTARPSSSPAAHGRPASSDSSGTAASPARPQLPQVSLQGLRWSEFYGIELPFSVQAGPHDTRGGLAAGFAHSQLGALLAAVNIGVRANAQWGPRIFTAVIRSQVTGPDAAALLANCEAAYGQASQSRHVTDGQPLGTVDVTEEGFRWVAYTPTAAILDLVSAGPGSQGSTARASTQVEAVWDGGDWKLVAPPGGDWGSAATGLSSLSGYTVFPGQGGGS